MNRGRFPAVVFLVAFDCATLAFPLAAQATDCARLRQRIDDLARYPRPEADRYVRAARRQQQQIDRTLAYSRKLGCDAGQVPLVGDSPPAACAQIETRLGEMSNNLEVLKERAARAPEADGARRNDLIMQFEASCGSDGRAAADIPRRLYNDDDFGTRDEAALPPPGYRRMPLAPDDGESAAGPVMNEAPADAPAAESGAVLGGAKAVCVKTCDGSFFPVSYSASAASLPALEALCHADCPNAETKLYTYTIESEIDQAVDTDGQPYANLPNAKRYQKVYDRACSCRAPGKSWVETLAAAERLYAGDARDVVVTASMSDASVRPRPADATTRRAATVPAPRSRKSRAAAAAAAEDAEASDAKAAARVAPAGSESSGIDVDAAGRRGQDALDGEPPETNQGISRGWRSRNDPSDP